MNRGIVKLSDLIPVFPESKEEKSIRAPKSKPPKVIGDPTREPVNRQAALIASRSNWLSHPPLPPAEPPKGELEKLREENATLKATNINVIAENSALKRRIERLSVLVNRKPTNGVKVDVEAIPHTQSKIKSLLERLSDV